MGSFDNSKIRGEDELRVWVRFTLAMRLGRQHRDISDDCAEEPNQEEWERESEDEAVFGRPKFHREHRIDNIWVIKQSKEEERDP